MKKLFIFIFLFAFVATGYSQEVVNGFEAAAANNFFKHPPSHPGLANGSGAVVLTDVTSSNTPAPYDGTGALKIDWTVHSADSWGGYTQMMHLNDSSEHFYYDFSAATALSIRYYNAVKSSVPGAVYLRVKLHEAGGASDYWNDMNDHEDWYFQTLALTDDEPGWKELTVPLVDRGTANPNDLGFTLPGWSGKLNDGLLNLDKIIGYSLEFGTAGIADNGVATGTFYYDLFVTNGNKYTPIMTFDATADADSFWTAIDVMGWAGGDAVSSLVLTTNTTDKVEGTGAMEVAYTVNNSQSWGGYLNFEKNTGLITDLAKRGSLVVYLKSKTPYTSTNPNRVTFRFDLIENNSGADETWVCRIPIKLSATSEWQKFVLPLVQSAVVKDDTGNDNFPTDGFAQPWWDIKGDNNFNPEAVYKVKIELSGSANAGDLLGEKNTGVFLMDILQQAGEKASIDSIAPSAVSGLTITQGTYQNLVTWNEVAGETKETYTVYYSDKPIVNVADAEVVKLNITEGTHEATQILRAPNTDANVSYYYAITCKDAAGNVSEAATLGTPVTNAAKGVPTISKTAPANFKADGDLAEWTTVTPIEIVQTKGTGFLAPNGLWDGDQDISVTAYIAVDQDNLYFAADVTDDIYAWSAANNSYMNDCVDLFLGLFDAHKTAFSVYKRGVTPHYHLRFDEKQILMEGGANADSLALNDGANYYFGQKALTSGYFIEAKISFADLAHRRDSGDLDEVFVPVEGMKIPLDFSINDADATGARELVFCYSPYNQDLSYGDPQRWLWTWIGDKETVGINDENNVVNSFSLAQNFPNPFNPTTQINYSLQKPEMVTLRIFDVLGREVMILVNQNQTAGIHSVSCNASSLASGMYFYKLEAGSFQSIKKMMLLK